jgi:hypothetical protein
LAISIALSRQLSEEEIDSGRATLPSSDEVRSSVRRSLTRLDHSRNPVNLGTAAVDAVVGELSCARPAVRGGEILRFRDGVDIK